MHALLWIDMEVAEVAASHMNDCKEARIGVVAWAGALEIETPLGICERIRPSISPKHGRRTKETKRSKPTRQPATNQPTQQSTTLHQ